MIPRIRVKTSKTPHVDWLREQLGEDAVIRLIGEPVEAIEVEAAGHNERSLGALIGAMPELPARRTNPAREQLREYAGRGWDELTGAERSQLARLMFEALFG